jgi:ABC-type arginine transport system ATPase subunit
VIYISNDLSKLKRIADDYINSLGDSDSLEHTPESEALELRLDEAQYKLYNKLNTLDNLIHALVKVGKISKNKIFLNGLIILDLWILRIFNNIY